MAWKYRKLIANLANGVIAAFRPGPVADELVRRARAEAEQVLREAGIAVVTAEHARLGRPPRSLDAGASLAQLGS